MTTITLPPDLEAPLLAAATQRGTTPELLALDSLRRLFVPVQTAAETVVGASLFDRLSDYVGAIDGPSEAWSEDCGQRFGDGLLEKHPQGAV